jgi:fatty acid desaturase
MVRVQHVPAMESQSSETKVSGEAQPGPIATFLDSRYSPLLTHFSLVCISLCMFWLLLRLPFFFAFLPCVAIHHRIGILLHEYVHGIPFRKYRHNLWVLTLFEGLLLSCGMFELFRATHLAHHRWLNTIRDPAMQAEHQNGGNGSILSRLAVLEASQQLKFLMLYLRGEVPYIRTSHFVRGLLASLLAIFGWCYFGHPWMLAKLAVLTVTTSLLSSFRGAVEHHGPPGQAAFSNEYRVRTSLFNLNRHIDHHLNPGRPWYKLRFRSEKPLPPICYWTYWFHVYVKRDYVLLPPPAQPHMDPGR